MAVDKETILRVTKDDCKWEYFRGSGAGGQKRNKTSNAVRCTHVASGAVGRAEDGRSQAQNRQLAFSRMANSTLFRTWIRIRLAQIAGAEEQARAYAEREANSSRTRIEVKQDGRWVEVAEAELSNEET